MTDLQGAGERGRWVHVGVGNRGRKGIRDMTEGVVVQCVLKLIKE